ncbi:MAG TPA: hypothetical protein VL020_02020 [Pseudomonadales bacterium]|nr:hypothetical protein [Pseudomonadales bacterium]
MLQGSLSVIIILFVIVLTAMVVFLLWRSQWFIQWLKGTLGIGLVVAAIFLLFGLIDLWSYQQLNNEKLISTVSIYQLDEQEYDLTLINTKGEEQRFKILGDQWQLDARLLVWKGPINALGASPLFRLDRLSGRYLTLEQERSAERTVYELAHSPGLDIWQWVNKHGFWLDAQFGSAVYLPLSNGAVYGINLSAKGLVARPLNDAAEQALAQQW